MSYRLINVFYNYGKVQVLNNISLSFDQGEIHAVVGQNGAGKTTLMRILGGYLIPKKGTVEAEEGRVAMVHQHFMLIDEFTVAENLYLSQINNTSLKPKEILKKSQKILDDLEWNLPFEANVGDLKIGDHQRLEILKAILQETPFIILDEPTAVLSESEVQSLFKNLRYLAKKGRGIILIAHKPNEVIELADRISVLREGQLIWSKENKNITPDFLINAIIGKEFQWENSSKKVIKESQSLLEIKNGSTTATRYEVSLKNISLNLKKGEIFGIGGIDGNGQKELAELILNFRKLNQGERIEKKDLTLAYLPQNPPQEALALSMSLVENLLIDDHRLLFLKKGCVWSKELKNWAKERLIKFNVKHDDIDQPISSLSGGNQQKLILSRLECLNSDIWVAMNPTRGLDVAAAHFIHQKIKQYAQRGTCIVLISSDLDELTSFSNHLMFLRDGNLEKEFLVS